MKILLFLIFSLSTSVFACPTLTGSYTCTPSQGTFTMSISQTTDDEVTAYTVAINDGTSFTLTANGEAETVTFTVNGVEYSGSLTTTCTDPSLTTTFVTTYQGENVTATLVTTPVSEGLSLTNTVQVDSQPAQSQTFDCTMDSSIAGI